MRRNDGTDRTGQRLLGALRRLERFEEKSPVPPTDLSAILSRRSPWWRLAPRRLGRIAAAILALVGLASLTRARVEAREGAVTLSFSLPWAEVGAQEHGGAPSPLLVRETLVEILEPSLRGIAVALAALEGRRREDSEVLALALADTRRSLGWTQEAVLEVAGRTPPARPGW
jgi:hypothetical protein